MRQSVYKCVPTVSARPSCAGTRPRSPCFFQAEDGIRAGRVTGVQTCALPISGGVRDLLQSRLVAVSETGWQLLTTASAIGRSFDFDTLREASGRSEEETVTALEELIGQGLVAEVRS